MTARPKTLQIFLPGGDPQGIRVAEITTRIVQVIDVPRKLLSDFNKMDESTQVAVYFLVSQPNDEESTVYIGQSGDLKARLTKHDKDKEFWERALVVVSRTNSLTQTHALFLESYCLSECRKAGRYRDENGNQGTKPHTPAPLQADCLEIFDTAKTLLATLGHPLFDPVVGDDGADDQLTLFCTASGADGRGIYTEEGFVVLEGSTGRSEDVPSLATHSGGALRQRLRDTGVVRVEGDQLVFDKDHLFRSPSMAAAAVMGRASNGWIDWKDAGGRTMDEIYRSQEPKSE